ncbi:MAG TPA: hypothetical protein VFP84_04950 [Kofleriaceae bacterium]|nr:hypothetical protein [Kofleriaceae bacterium]
MTTLVGCGGGESSGPNEPKTAKEKQRQDAAASGEADEPTGKGKGWRYAGDRDECFFVVGHRCFKTEAAACKFARCGSAKCNVDGGGPATVTCVK